MKKPKYLKVRTIKLKVYSATCASYPDLQVEIDSDEQLGTQYFYKIYVLNIPIVTFAFQTNNISTVPA